MNPRVGVEHPRLCDLRNRAAAALFTKNQEHQGIFSRFAILRFGAQIAFVDAATQLRN